MSFSLSDETPVTSVDSLALQGAYGGNAVAIRSIKPRERPPRVVLLVDTSKSMEPLESAAAILAERFISGLPSESEIGLGFFASNYSLMAPLGKDRGKLTFALEALKNRQYYAEGQTALWSAVGEAAKMFGAPTYGDAIYIISDGGDNRSRTVMRGVLEALTGSGIRLFAAVLAGPFSLRSRTPEELEGPGMMKEAVHTAGGTLLFDPEWPGGYYSALDMVGKNGKPTRFAIDLNRQLSQIVNFYQLEISIPQPIHKPQSWRLQIVRDAHSSDERLRLFYPTLLMPCQ